MLTARCLIRSIWYAECWRLAFQHFGKSIPQADIRTQIGSMAIISFRCF